MIKIAIDIGYSFTKIMYENKLYKIPSAVSYALDMGIEYGTNDVYDFEGEKLYVGEMAASSESFNTGDYKFLYKYGPLIIYHIIKKLGIDISQSNSEIELRTGLALVDLVNKQSFAERLALLKVNNQEVKTRPIIIPQGAGAVASYIHNERNGEYPNSLFAIDIGYRTINILSYEGKDAIKQRCKSYPGHGVTSIIKPFANFMETKFGLPFSEAEIIKIFLKKEFKFQGELRPEVSTMIEELKLKFVNKLMNSILENEKKYLALSDVVLLVGGGSYMLADIRLPANTVFPKDGNYEFQNVIGYYL